MTPVSSPYTHANLLLEQEVLGILLLYGQKALDTVANYLLPDSFYRIEHQVIYSQILDLSARGLPISEITVLGALRLSGRLEQAGGAGYCCSPTTKVSSSCGLEYTCLLIEQEAIRRRLLDFSLELETAVLKGEKDIFDLLDEARQGLYSVTAHISQEKDITLATGLSETLKAMEERSALGNEITGIASGFRMLDRITHGWRPGQLILLAARPGAGKSAFALNCARNAAAHKLPVLFFSMEMSREELIQRLLAAESRMDHHEIAGCVPENQWEAVHRGITSLHRFPLYIDDQGGLKIEQLCSRARKYAEKYGLKLIVVDYLQLISSPDKHRNREQEISHISRSLKALAKELDLPVIALSQLSRDSEKRGGNRMPLLSDLRDSGALEQDADQVLFLYRPEYHGITEDAEGRSTEGLCMVLVEKNRGGRLATGSSAPRLRWKPEFQKFYEYG